MVWQLINSKRSWKMGPAYIAQLEREADSREAMGNHAAARILRAEAYRQELLWDAKRERLAPSPMKTWVPRINDHKMDTQGH